MKPACACVLVLAIAPAFVWAAEPPAKTAIRLADGKFGKALDARAAPAVLEGSARFGQTPFTVECWVKLSSKAKANVLLANDSPASSSHWQLYTAAESGELRANFAATQPSEIQSKTNICDGDWHFLALVHDGKTVKLFVDAKLVAETAVEKKAASRPKIGELTVGGSRDGKEPLGCDGLIDEVRLSGSAREIKELPNAALLHDPYTIVLWHFDKPEDFQVDPAWTPKPLSGNVPAWEKATDKDWVDNRFREMDTGPFLNATFEHATWQGSQKVMKGTAIKLGDNGEATMLFDRNQLRMAAGWTGGFLEHGNRRFALLNTPKPAGQVKFASANGPGWADPKGEWSKLPSLTTALPHAWGHYGGLAVVGKRLILTYRIGERVVVEQPWAETADRITAFTRSFRVEPGQALRHLVCDLPGTGKATTIEGVACITAEREKETTAVALVGAEKSAQLELAGQTRVELAIPAAKTPCLCKLLIWHGQTADLGKFIALAKTSPPAQDRLEKPPAAWVNPEITKGILGSDDGPLAVDTFTLPYQNRYKSLMFVTGIDFLPTGQLVICTAHGDVWIGKALDERLEKIGWERIASGLYQPLGLKVVDGNIVVLERGQLTVLRDYDRDLIPDLYANVCGDWDTGGGEHSFDTCLEMDQDRNVYFFKTGDTHTPTGGCLLRIPLPQDGKLFKSEVFATGFRHPIGLGMSPDGILSGADQEGNWMPATRLDLYKQGGFYGDMRAHHRPTPPKIYDAPLCWLPRELGNSAGGQVWVPKGQWGPLGGQMLHLSYGRCRVMQVLQQEVDGQHQGGAANLGLNFLSGVCRGRFNPKDGHLYLAGLKGWQTASVQDGCVQRVRYTGKKMYLPTELAVHADGIRLAFSQPLDQASALNPKRYRVEQWNYRWSSDYGSQRWSVAEPSKIGQDAVAVQSVRLLPDGKSVFLRIKDLKPVMQMQLHFELAASDGQPLAGDIFNTIHRTGKPLQP